MILNNTSSTQVDNFEACERKWFWEKVVKVPRPAKLDLEIGVQKHAEIEDYFKTGALPTSECVKKAIKLIPERDETHLIEQAFRIPTYIGGPVWLGFIDLIDRTRFPDITIYDWKTTGNLRWAKTPLELQQNLQLLTYAHAVSDLLGIVRTIKGSHCYLQVPKGRYKNPEDAMLVPPVVLEKEAIAERWEKSLISVKAMVTLAAAEPKVEDVKPNWSACSAYGGCPYESKCAGVSNPSYEKKEIVSMTNMMERLLKGSQNGTANGATVVPPTPTETKRVVTVEIEGVSEGAIGVVPPDAPPPKLSTEIEAEAVAAAKEADPAPRKRGRPAKGATVSPAATSQPSSEPGPVASVAAAPAVSNEGLQLYIDCLPTKPAGVAITLFEDWIAPIAAAVAEAKGVEDYRLLTYGSGKVELSIAIRKLPVLQGVLVVSKMSPGADEALAVLKPLASVVVQALK